MRVSQPLAGQTKGLCTLGCDVLNGLGNAKLYPGSLFAPEHIRSDDAEGKVLHCDEQIHSQNNQLNIIG